MIIFLYGSDTYRLKKKLQEILKDYQNNSLEGVNFQYFDFSKEKESQENSHLSFDDFKKEISSVSLFSEKKAIILRNIFDSVEFKKKFLKEGEKFLKSKEIILICQEGDLNEKDELYEFLKKSAEVQEFKQLKGIKLRKWLKREFEKHKASIEPEALEELIAYTLGDLWRLSNEMQKLINYKNRQEITLEDIKLHVHPQIETDIFKTIDAIAQKNKKQALRLIHQHLEKGDSPLYIFAMMNFQFRNLLLVRDLIERRKSFGEIFQELPLHPLVIKKSYFQAKNFPFQTLKKIYQKLFQLDFQIKVGKIKPETALELFVAQL